MSNQVSHVTTAATSDGTVPAGNIAVGFAIASGGSALINGNILLHNSGIQTFDFPVLGQGIRHSEITYTVSSGTLYIVEFRQ